MKLKIPLWFVPNLLPGFHQRLVQHRLVKPGGPVPLTDGIQVEKGRLVAVESRLHHISHGSDCFTVQLHREVHLAIVTRKPFIQIETAFVPNTHLPQQNGDIASLAPLNGGMGIVWSAPEEQAVARQFRRARDLGIFAALGHLFQVQVAAISRG